MWRVCGLEDVLILKSALWSGVEWLLDSETVVLCERCDNFELQA